MEFDIDIEKFQLILLPGKSPPRKYREHYHKAYQCWREVWQHAYQVELHNDEYLSSDNFTRQDEVLALFYDGKCAGLTFFKWVDATEDPVIHDSYFRRWPEIAMRKLRSQGNNVIVCSQFTLHFDFRKNYLGLPWKDLLMALNAKRFDLSTDDAMTGTTRLAKNVGEVTYRTQAVPLIKNMAWANEEDRVDLVAWFKDRQHDSLVPGIAPLAEKLFAEKTVSLVNELHHKSEVKNAA